MHLNDKTYFSSFLPTIVQNYEASLSINKKKCVNNQKSIKKMQKNSLILTVVFLIQVLLTQIYSTNFFWSAVGGVMCF